jgi:diguanylate cyclase
LISGSTTFGNGSTEEGFISPFLVHRRIAMEAIETTDCLVEEHDVRHLLFEEESRRGIDPTTSARARSQVTATILMVSCLVGVFSALLSPGEVRPHADLILYLTSIGSLLSGVVVKKFGERINMSYVVPMGSVTILLFGYNISGPTDAIYGTLTMLVAVFFPRRQAAAHIGFLLLCLSASHLIDEGWRIGLAESMLASIWFVLLGAIVSSLRYVINELVARLHHQSNTDDLTGLANRFCFNEALQRELMHAEQRKTGLLLIDLDRFKEINDTLGHRYGDLLLQGVSRRLRDVIRSTDLVARLGGDEFAIVLRDVRTRDMVDRIAATTLQALSEPFYLDGTPVTIGASVGSTMAPDDGGEVSTILQTADLAMFASKERHSGSQTSVSDLSGNVVLLDELRTAIDREELHLAYQPKVDLDTGHLSGVEALVRWNHPSRTDLSPATFIPVAERTGLIKPLTDLVLRQAFRQHLQWRVTGLDVQVAVNISARSLSDPGFVNQVMRLVFEEQADPSRFVLELTESAMMADPDHAAAVLLQLRDLGFGISIDDFGTGHSSLAYLHALPATEVKIDRSFVSDLPNSESSRLIVNMAIHLARTLGHRVVAEGVETEEVLDTLRSLGCNVAQGYYFAGPLSADELVTWASHHNAATSASLNMAAW